MKEFVLLITGIVLALFGIAVRHYGTAWLKTRAGKGVLFGLFVAPLIALLLGLVSGCAHSNRVEVFAGIEQTKSRSPQCEPGGASDRLTSNLGVQWTGIVSEDRRTEMAVGYRHHSCAITPDAESYDAIFIETTRVLKTW